MPIADSNLREETKLQHLGHDVAARPPAATEEARKQWRVWGCGGRRRRRRRGQRGSESDGATADTDDSRGGGGGGEGVLTRWRRWMSGAKEEGGVDKVEAMGHDGHRKDAEEKERAWLV